MWIESASVMAAGLVVWVIGVSLVPRRHNILSGFLLIVGILLAGTVAPAMVNKIDLLGQEGWMGFYGLILQCMERYKWILPLISLGLVITELVYSLLPDWRTSGNTFLPTPYVAPAPGAAAVPGAPGRPGKEWPIAIFDAIMAAILLAMLIAYGKSGYTALTRPYVDEIFITFGEAMKDADGVTVILDQSYVPARFTLEGRAIEKTDAQDHWKKLVTDAYFEKFGKANNETLTVSKVHRVIVHSNRTGKLLKEYIVELTGIVKNSDHTKAEEPVDQVGFIFSTGLDGDGTKAELQKWIDAAADVKAPHKGSVVAPSTPNPPSGATHLLSPPPKFIKIR